jgi:hypothetical protein
MRHDPDRRKFLEISGGTGLAVAGGLLVPGSLEAVSAEERTSPPAVDYTIRIAHVSHEIAPGQIIKTTAYNETGLCLVRSFGFGRAGQSGSR